MNFNKATSRLAAAAVLPLAGSTLAEAQSLDLANVPGLSYSRPTSRETWRTVMLVSGIFLVAGLASDESSLVVIGGLGLLISLMQTNGQYYRPNTSGMDVLRFGKLSFGVNPFGSLRTAQGTPAGNPNFVMQAKFKF